MGYLETLGVKPYMPKEEGTYMEGVETNETFDCPCNGNYFGTIDAEGIELEPVREKGYLGWFLNLKECLEAYPNPRKGMTYNNVETRSVWIYDGAHWRNTTQGNPFHLIYDIENAGAVKRGYAQSFYYVPTQHDVDGGTITFHFLVDGRDMWVECDVHYTSDIVLIEWNGSDFVSRVRSLDERTAYVEGGKVVDGQGRVVVDSNAIESAIDDCGEKIETEKNRAEGAEEELAENLSILQGNTQSAVSVLSRAINAEQLRAEEAEAGIETELDSLEQEYGKFVGTVQQGLGVLARAVADKQDEIPDLDTIRSGAEKGAGLVRSDGALVLEKGVIVDNDYGAVYALPNDDRSNSEEVDFNLVAEEFLKTINGQSLVRMPGEDGNIEITGGGGADMSEYVDEEGYLLSNGERVDMRFTRSLLPVGTEVVASANLNTIEYLKVGKYFCRQNATAKTVKNCPVNVAFSMEVFNPLSPTYDDETTADYTYRVRVLTQYDTGQQYLQFCKTSGTPGKWTYESWYVTPRTLFTLASSKNDGTAALGSGTQGIYVDSTGTLKKMTYTLAKSVPSSAVFTDTKVTAVGNHYSPAATDILQASGGDLTDISNSEEGIQVITELHRDAAGHITDVSSVALTSTTVLPFTPIVYSNLVSLRNNRKLVPGCWYRIVDYTTVIAGEEVNGHDFDVIVLATGIDTLSEEARARKKDGDTYFANSNLDAWKIWYCLDNDKNRFDWADSENGKGVIYRMIDEYNNDCPFDFKNVIMQPADVGIVCYDKTIFSYKNEDSQYSDLTIVDRTDDEETVVKPRNNYIAPLIVNGKMSIPYISFEYSYDYDSGIVYECQNNKIGPNCNHIVFKDTCSNNIIGSNCNRIEFSTDCIGNIIGDNCDDITILEYSKYNTIGSECSVITIEDNCRDCVVSTSCNNITIGFDSSSIEFGASCSTITIGHSNRNIKFGNDCSNVLFVEGQDSNNYADNISGMLNITVGGNVQNAYFFKTNDHFVGNTEIASDIVDEEVALPSNFGGNWKIAKNSNGEVKVYCEAVAVEYVTMSYFDSVVGDVNGILESIING